MAAALPTATPWQAQPLYQSPYAGQATDPTQAPIAPQYNSTWNPGMAEAPVIGGMLNNVQYNTQPLTNLASYAANPNASPWAQASNLASYQQQNEAAQNLTGQTAGSVAGAEGALALQGGLSSGAGEEARLTGIRSDVGGEQNIGSQGMQQRAQIGINDAANKLQAQEALPGMETQAYNTELEPIQMYGQAYGQDVANQMAATQGLNAFNMNLYGTQGAMWGANQQANATTQAEQEAQNTSGILGGGGILGTGIGNPTSAYNNNFTGALTGAMPANKISGWL